MRIRSWLIVLLMALSPTPFADSSQVRLRVGDGELVSLRDALPPTLRLDASNASRYVLVSWHAGVRFETVYSEVQRLGGVTFGKVGPQTLVARLEPAKQSELNGRSSILDLSIYQPGYKLDRSLQLFDGSRQLSLLLWPGESEPALDASLKKLGVQVIERHLGQRVVEADWQSVVQLLKLDAVRMVSSHTPMRPLGGEINGVVQIGERGDALPYAAVGVDGGGIGGASTCTVSGLSCTDASDCSGAEDVCPTAAQTLLSIDTGIQLDAADLSNTASAAGIAGLAHRKVRRYQSASAFGGAGDLLGCDVAALGGLTHGHAVAAYAIGNATEVSGAYGAGQQILDDSGILRSLDGVAPGALLVAIDAQVTPAIGPCPSAEDARVTPGDLFDGVGGGALEETYLANGVRTSLLAWGGGDGDYTPEAIDVDAFLKSHPDALIIAATGLAEARSPATAKNVLSVGVGESLVGAGPQGRIPVQLVITEKLMSDFVCASSDLDQSDPVDCLPVELTGTSAAASLLSGGALLVRDYFAKGFYPDGRDSNLSNGSDRVPNISGALNNALLVASADYPQLVSAPSRFNDLFGFGQPNLSNVLPLDAEASSVTALAVVDGAVGGGPIDLPGLNGQIDATVVGQQSATFELCDSTQELRVALAWMDTLDGGLTGALVNNLDLELVSPTGVVYRGNDFTDDDDGDGALDLTTEECPSVNGASGALDASAWSLPACDHADMTPSANDVLHTVEAIFLSPDYYGDDDNDLNPADDNQIELGGWTVQVLTDGGGTETAQPFAVVVAGGLCRGSSVRATASSYGCNGEFSATISDFAEPGDLVVDIAEVTGRAHVELLEAGQVVDCEGAGCGAQPLPWVNQPNTAETLFELQPLVLSSHTARDPGNGVLDVRHGDTVRVIYADELNGIPEADRRRVGRAEIDCAINVSPGSVLLQQWGIDRSSRLEGGCERSARGMFEYGFPDRYMDAGERVVLQFAIASDEAITLPSVEVALRCVEVDDLQAPESCVPGSDDCADPNRLNNAACPASYLTIVNPIQLIGDVAARSALAISFDITMGAEGAIPPNHEVEFVLDLIAPLAGFTQATTLVSRQTIDADEFSLYYSTDFPTGGTEFADLNNDERIDDPLQSADVDLDYRFETRAWSDLTAGGTRNGQLQSPWNFDLGDGGFTSGISSETDYAVIGTSLTQWGEDLNFNGLLDGYCSSGACIDSGTRCVSAAQCAGVGGGGVCLFTPLGWCGGNVGGTQCTAFDDPADPDLISEDCEGNVDGQSCDLVDCNFSSACASAISMLVNPVGGPIACYSADEDIDPVNLALDTNSGAAGGCGWQSAAPGSCSLSSVACYVDADCAAGETCDTALPQPNGGIWHTGRIGTPNQDCDLLSGTPTDCSLYKVLNSGTPQLTWWELLLTPEIEKVNGSDYELDILDWGWNAAVDIAGDGTALTWAVDLDLTQNDLIRSSYDNVLLWVDTTSPTQSRRVDTKGYPMFAPIGLTLDDSNGVVGGNRIGTNACFFSQDTAISPSEFDLFQLASPADDDLANGRCPGLIPTSCTARCVGGGSSQNRCNDLIGDSDCPGGDCRVDSADQDFNDCDVTDSCVSNVCAVNGAACSVDADCFSCQIDDANIDEFVAANGPIRNMSLRQNTPIDGRELTVGDVVGPAGDRFQAAVGILSTDSSESERSYGLGFDDMVIEWREYTSVPDATLCSSGACATVSTSTSRIAGAEGLIPLRIVDATPSNNDCNGDGDRSDPEDDMDCDDDGTPDVVIVASSEFDSQEQRFVVPQSSAGFYELMLPYSQSLNLAGLFYIPKQRQTSLLNAFAPQAITDQTDLVFGYADLDDGSGQPCAGNVAEAVGVVELVVTLTNDSAPAARDLAVVSVRLRDNGDDDGWADSNETVELDLVVRNLSATPITGLELLAWSDSPGIDCVIEPVAIFPTLPVAGEVSTAAPIRFRVSDVDRTALGLSEFDDLLAQIQLTARADQFEVQALEPVELQLDLDVALSGAGPTVFAEAFENGFGAFDDFQNIDAGKGDAVSSDGYRCQYHDPDFPLTATYGSINDCWLGASPAQADTYHWWVHDGSASDGGRSFEGSQSLKFGIDLGGALGFTTPMASLEAIATSQPINLGWDRVCEQSRLVGCAQDSDCPVGEPCVAATPRLTFKHQLSAVDYRTVGTVHSADAAVVQLRSVDAAGVPVGDWVNISPVVNGYDVMREDNFSNCMFDPIDDGSDEDDLFDPINPEPRQGPSSTCAPQPVFGFIGDTFSAFDPFVERLGAALDGPPLMGATGVGSWIESTFDLSEFRGRRVHLRFLYTTLKVGTSPSYEAIFNFNPNPGDDGWWIDDVELTDTLATAATLVVDTKDNSSLPACDSCQLLSVELEQSPSAPASAPGQAVLWEASVDAGAGCPGGIPLYRYWLDGDGNGLGGDPIDLLLRDYSTQSEYWAAPSATADYVVEVRCSSDPSCSASASFSRAVNCPSSAAVLFPTLSAVSADQFGWGAVIPSFFARGDLTLVSSLSPLAFGSLGSTASLDISTDSPAAGGGFWYLFREDVTAAAFCNAPGSWSSGGSGELPGRTGVLP
jgi:hypothetical protein